MTEELWTFGTALGGETGELHGMSVEALDGRIGKVEDVVDRIGGAYLLVDTGPSTGGKAVMLPAGVVVAVNAPKGSIYVDRTREDVTDAPRYNPEAPDDADHHDALTAYYSSLGSNANAPAGSQASAGGDHEGEGRSGGAAEHDVSQAGAAVELSEGGSARGSGESDATSASPSDVIHSQRTKQDEREGGTRGRPEISPQTENAASMSSDEDNRSTRLKRVIPSKSSGGAGTDARETEAANEAVAQTSTQTGGVAPTSAQAISAETHTSQKASADVEEKRPTRTKEASGKKGSTRDADSGAARSGSASSSDRRSRRSGASSRSSSKALIARFDSLTAAEVAARLRNLSQRELAEAERYEKAHERRQTVLSRIDDLREDEPWRGYDNATVNEVTKKLAGGDDARAKAVRDYERRHRDRKGVMDAARRTVASA